MNINANIGLLKNDNDNNIDKLYKNFVIEKALPYLGEFKIGTF
jgi:hypothetical protein